MGVFSLFRRKAKDTEEAAVTATEPTAQTEAEESGEAKESTEATRPEAEAETKTEAEAKAEDEGAESAAETVDAGDDVEIPKQQTADQAADNEAGESARK
ncbi:hypothetical protein [Streptomyces sp. NBC_00391]|uniref:hypothetical protein n=1 Tax=Streptomyces sp. NBC_00391 TaxID=2903647 RepID=UPI002E20D367